MKHIQIVFSIAVSLCLYGCSETTTENTVQSEQNSVTSKTEPTTTEPKAETFVSKLPDSAPVLSVGTSTPAPPFIFKDEYGNIQGIDVDVIRAIGEDQGFKVEINNDPWDELFDKVAVGERDLAIAGISYNTERDEKYGLSNSYFFNPSAIMYTDSSLTINNLDDLQGLRVASNPGTKQLSQLQEREGYAELLEVETVFLMFQLLVQDKVDAVVLDRPILQYTAKSFPQQQVNVVAYEGHETPESQTVIVTQKNNSALLDKINAGIENIEASGELKRIETKWLAN